jgi:hypothetical protein
LLAFSKYDSNVGYVQGMNFLVGSLLHHCSEEIAFWLFVAIVEEYWLRDVFQVKLPGLYKHIALMEHLLQTYLPDLSAHLAACNISPEVYSSDWIFTLYANVVPIERYQLFLTNFFEDGWAFFYRFTLTYYEVLAP